MVDTRVLVSLAVSLLGIAAAAQQTPPPPTEAQQRPVFRAGTHFVRVDAYPTGKDGQILEGLTRDDFEVLEDGKAQAIESFDFVKFDTFTPEELRVEPRSQQEGFDMAADPRNRVFVILVDLPAVDPGQPAETDIWHIQQPLVNFLDRVLSQQDLFGFITSRNTAKDLVLARRTTQVRSQIVDMFRAANQDRDDASELDACPNGAGAMKGRFRADQLYTALETVVQQLGTIREERKSIVFVAKGITRERSSLKALDLNGGQMPRIGIVNGRVGIGNRNSPTGVNDIYCTSEVQRLAAIDFDERYRRLLKDARDQNVAFYPINPAGLQAPVTPAGISAVTAANDNLRTLADETDGVAIVDDNDLTGGMRKIANDIGAYYVLGYYTTNTRWDGGLRAIKVRLKSGPAAGKNIRARRQYRAPTAQEIAALSSAASRPAAAAPGPAAASPVSPSAAPALIGAPVAYRIVARQPPEKMATPAFERTDRLRVEWPILAALDRREARMLDRNGKPLPVDLPLAENEAAHLLVVELPLAPFARGEYVIELTAGAGGRTEQRRLAFSMK